MTNFHHEDSYSMKENYSIIDNYKIVSVWLPLMYTRKIQKPLYEDLPQRKLKQFFSDLLEDKDKWI